jgi:site-specific DNA-cytosine methylase|nr:MAG TPA: DNA methylase [Caudoviricetes sp.]
MSRLKVFEAFAGIGSQSIALRNIDVPYEVVAISEIDKIQQAGISNTQQYKLAGNSIVVNVLEAIFRNLFK